MFQGRSLMGREKTTKGSNALAPILPFTTGASSSYLAGSNEGTDERPG